MKNSKSVINKAAVASLLAGTIAPFAMNASTVFAAETSQKAVNGEVTLNQADGSGVKDGSITIQGANVAQSIKNKKFEFFKIFNVENAAKNESVNYTFNPKYENVIKEVVAAKLSKRDNKTVKASDVSEYMAIDYIQSLNTNKVAGAQTEQKAETSYSAFRYFVEDVKAAIRKAKIAGDIVEVESPSTTNEVTVNGLSHGYYLVDEISTGDAVSNGQKTKNAKTPENHSAESDGIHFASSLVLVNTVNNHFTIKLKSDYPTIVKKIQEDDNRDAVKNNGWNDMADYEIGQTVPYQNTVSIPNMNGYESYYMAVQDKMDQALTFNADKSKVKLTITNGEKSYRLKDSEFNLQTYGENVSKEATGVTIAPEGDTTFVAEVVDIKAIIDREFDKIDAKSKENDYSGLQLKVEYEATLNDKAVQDLGRPGYENDVRLVYSNNPDNKEQKGKTPWDTVVAFSYKLNGLKVNSNNFALEDAEFKLYSDEQLQNEIYLKKVPGTDGYVVVNRDSLGGKDHTGGDAPTNAETIKSDKNGNFVIAGLDSGTYYLKETKAPKGYRELKDPIKVDIKATMNDERNTYVKGDGATDKALKSLTATGDIKEFLNEVFKTGHSELQTNVDEGSVDLKVVNEVQKKLPNTGAYGMPVTIALGVALISIGAVLTYRHKRQVKDAE